MRRDACQEHFVLHLLMSHLSCVRYGGLRTGSGPLSGVILLTSIVILWGEAFVFLLPLYLVTSNTSYILLSYILTRLCDFGGETCDATVCVVHERVSADCHGSDLGTLSGMD